MPEVLVFFKGSQANGFALILPVFLLISAFIRTNNTDSVARILQFLTSPSIITKLHTATLLLLLLLTARY